MKRLFLLLFSILPGMLFADNVTVEKAQAVAQKFMQDSGIPQTRSTQLRMAWDGENPLTRDQREPAFYVFNLEGGQGFVVVSADDRAMPILGYSFESSFDEHNIPIAMRGHMMDYREQINYLRDTNAKRSEGAISAWNEATRVTRGKEDYNKNVHGNIIVEYETAKWDQDEPFNRLCPSIRGHKTLSGCQITSMCILMKYFGWPDKGEGTVPGYTTEAGIRLKSIKLGHEYHWDQMPMVYKKGQYTDKEGDLVARIMYDFGVMIRAEYGPETGAIPQDVPRAMFTYLKYDKSMIYRPQEYYSLSTWMDMIKSELDRCPILYTGADAGGAGGHAFVFDGYSDKDYFHVNWGWSGICDGWWKISALDPLDQGSGGNGANFNSMQGAGFNMKPDEGGQRVGADIKYLCNFQWQGREWYGLKSKTSKIQTGTPFEAECGILFNIGDRSINGIYSFWLCDYNGNMKEQLIVRANGGESAELESGQMDPWGSAITIPSMQMTVKTNIEKGDRIRGFYKKDGKWEVITGTSDGKCSWEILCNEDVPADVDIEATTSIQFDKASQVMTLMVARGVEVQVLTASGQNIASTCATVKGSKVEIDGKKMEAGSYTIKLVADKATKEFKYTVGAAK